MIIYHGTKEENLIPIFGKGRDDNDYGKGFYTTEDIELAKEWSYSFWDGYYNNGYVYEYYLDTEGLKILNLDNEDPKIWIASLIYHRNKYLKDHIINDNYHKFIDRFFINFDNYDIVEGYRVDDSYYNIIRSFLENKITYESTIYSFKYGNLGKQICLKSKKSFENLKLINKNKVDKIYNIKYKNRKSNADKKYYSTVLSDSKINRRTTKMKFFYDIIDEIDLDWD